MLQGRFVDLDKAAGGSERTVADKIGRNLRRDDMDHVEALLDARDGIAAFLFEGRDLGGAVDGNQFGLEIQMRSEEHTSELQSLMRISYAVFCFKINKSFLYSYLPLF